MENYKIYEFLERNESYFHFLFKDKPHGATIEELLACYKKYQKGKVTEKSVLSKLEELMKHDVISEMDMPILTSVHEFNGSYFEPTRYYFDRSMYSFAKVLAMQSI